MSSTMPPSAYQLPAPPLPLLNRLGDLPRFDACELTSERLADLHNPLVLTGVLEGVAAGDWTRARLADMAVPLLGSEHQAKPVAV